MDKHLRTDDTIQRPRRGPFQFQTRHILYLFTAVCVLLGVPGLTYIAGWVVLPWLMLAAVVGPLLVGQFLFIFLIPPLRDKLLRHAAFKQNIQTKDVAETPDDF